MYNYGFIILRSQAFTMIDQNRDGFIDINDLREMFSSLGKWELTITESVE